MADVHIPGVQIDLPMEAIAEFCRKWKIEELALFGSGLRADFRPDSDIDVLVTFAVDVVLSIHDYLGMKQEFETLFTESRSIGSSNSRKKPELHPS